MSNDLWIVVSNWDRFQHYKDRTPPWIKNYVALLHDDDYLSLPPGTRAVLHGLWLEYAITDGRVRADTRSLSRRLRLRVTSQQLEQLNHAGFLTFRASKPLALTRSREKRREEKDRSALAPEEKNGGGLERIQVDQDSLELAHGWLKEHTNG